ncbi:MAG: nitroreductase family protein [Brevinema sp.]
MNLESMKERHTVRQYDVNRPVSDEVLNEVLAATRQAPTAIGAQNVSVIVVKEQESRNYVMEHSRGARGLQQFIGEAPVLLIFLIDFYKVDQGMKLSGNSIAIQQNINGIVTGVTDVGIALGAATVAAEALGLGTCILGSIRNNDMEAFIKYFNIPQYAFPVCAMTIGYPSVEDNKVGTKPRLPMNFFAHNEKYDTSIYANLADVVAKNEKELSEWAGQPLSWVDYPNMAYSQARHEHINKNLKSQGFTF